jgi:hypothetical protein
VCQNDESGLGDFFRMRLAKVSHGTRFRRTSNSFGQSLPVTKRRSLAAS